MRNRPGRPTPKWSAVTWNLNMSNETVAAEGPSVAGGADFGFPGDNPMSDPDGDGICTLTLQVASGYTGYYTFTNGACADWSCKENIAGQACANPANYNDRSVGEHHRGHGDQHLLWPVHHRRQLRPLPALSTSPSRWT